MVKNIITAWKKISVWISSKRALLAIGCLFVLSVVLVIAALNKTGPAEKSKTNNALIYGLNKTEKLLAGITAQGKIDNEHALWLKTVNPNEYQKLADNGLIQSPGHIKSPLPDIQISQLNQINSLLPLSSPSAQISACSEISQPGSYTILHNISSSSGTCLNIHNTQNVNLDCKGNSVSGYNQGHGGSGILISNVRNFSLSNCNINTTSSSSTGLNLLV